MRWSAADITCRRHFTTSFDGAIGGGSNSKSWSRESICRFPISDYQPEILKGAWGQKVAGADLAVPTSYGLFDDQRTFRGFAYHSGGPLDILLDRLTDEYASLVTYAYDYERLSKSWNIPVEELWVAMQHETAYSILGNLVRSGKLAVPDPLRGIGETKACRTVISIRLLHPPQDSKALPR